MGIDLAADSAQFLSPGSEFASIPGAGHFLHVERPEVVNAAVLKFFASMGY